MLYDSGGLANCYNTALKWIHPKTPMQISKVRVRSANEIDGVFALRNLSFEF
jgi:hypothetical protein